MRRLSADAGTADAAISRAESFFSPLISVMWFTLKSWLFQKIGQVPLSPSSPCTSLWSPEVHFVFILRLYICLCTKPSLQLFESDALLDSAAASWLQHVFVIYIDSQSYNESEEPCQTAYKPQCCIHAHSRHWHWPTFYNMTPWFLCIWAGDSHGRRHYVAWLSLSPSVSFLRLWSQNGTYSTFTWTWRVNSWWWFVISG